jgi:hypothetical protein
MDTYEYGLFFSVSCKGGSVYLQWNICTWRLLFLHRFARVVGASSRHAPYLMRAEWCLRP